MEPERALRRGAAVLLACATSLGSAAGAAPPQTVTVGSKNFTESRLLGELMTLLLEEHTGLAVRHRANLGGTLVCFTALQTGEIDLYAEYTGTGWSVILGEGDEVSDPLRAYLGVQAGFRARYELEWLQPFGFDNTYALAMDEAKAEALGVRTISQLAEHAPGLRAGFSVEFVSREDGWPGLARRYGIELAELRAMEHALAYEALAAGAIDLVDAYSTDGKLLRLPLRVLEDDRGFFPPYDAAPVARAALLSAHPEVREVLERLAFRIPEARMRELNHAVESEGRDFAAVARSFLEEEGLLEPAAGARDDPRRGARGLLAFLAARRAETLELVWEHVLLTAISVLVAALFAIPLGIWITRHRIAARLSLGAAGVVQTIPSLALLAVLVAAPGMGLSVRSALFALFLYALLPILRNTVTGLRGVDPDLIDAARGLGLTPRQILLRVQLPLATRTILAGVRTATVINVGVATLAAFIGAGGLGEPILTGLYLNDPRLILSGALPAAVLALAADLALSRLELALTPRPLR